MNAAAVVVSVVSTLNADSILTSLLSVGTGSNKVRYSRSLTIDADPIVAVDPAPSSSGIVTGSFTLPIEFHCIVKAEARPGVAITDPMKLSSDLANRISRMFIGFRGCNIPRGAVDSVDLPELVEVEQGVFWRSVVRVRFFHST